MEAQRPQINKVIKKNNADDITISDLSYPMEPYEQKQTHGSMK